MQAGHFDQIYSVAFSPDGKLVASGSSDETIRVWDPRNGRLLRVLRDGNGTVARLAFSPNSRQIVSAGGGAKINVWDVYTGKLVRSLERVVWNYNPNFALGPDGRKIVMSDDSGGLFLRDFRTGTSLAEPLRAAHPFRIPRFTNNGNGLIVYHTGEGLVLLDPDTLATRAKLMPAIPNDDYANFEGLSISSDGKRAVYRSYDKALDRVFLHIWDLAGRRELHRLEMPGDSGVGDLEFSPDSAWLAVATHRGPILFYNVEKGNLLFSLRGHEYSLNNYTYMAFAPCQSLNPKGECISWKRVLASVSSDNTLRLWELPSGRQLNTVPPQAVEVTSMAASPDRRWLVTGATSGEATLWDLGSGSRAAVFRSERKKPEDMPVRAEGHVAFQPQNEWFAAVAKDRSLRFWDPARGDEARIALIGDGKITHLTITPDARWLLVNSVGVAFFRNDLRNAASRNRIEATSLLEPPEGQSSSALKYEWVSGGNPMVCSANSKLMAHGTSGPYVGIWDLQRWKKMREIKTGLTRAEVVALSPDGRWLFVAEWSEERMELWDLSGDQAPHILSGKSGGITQAIFSPDGKWIAVAAFNEIGVWSVPEGRPLRRFAGGVAYLNAVTFSPCAEPAENGVCPSASSLLFGAGIDGTTYVWDFESGNLLATLYSFANSPDWLVLSPDGLFDGTPGAWRQILWRFRGNLFDVAPVEMFFNEYYRPGLLSELMAGERPQAPRDIAGVDRRVPRVEVKFPGGLPERPMAERQVTLRVVVRESPPDAQHPRGSGARDLRLFRNGALVKHWPRVPLPAGGGSVALETRVALVAGENRFTAYAFNRENVKSEDGALNVTGAKTLARAAVAHVLAVGVSRYANPEFNLTFAHSDAERFATALEEEEKRLRIFSAVRVTKLLNEQATKKNILDALETLARAAQPEDSVFLFFSGHGSAAGPRFYFVPHDLGYRGFRDPMSTDGWETIQRSSVSDLDLQRALERLDAGTIVLVIDACNSGQALEAPELDPSKPPDDAERLRRQLFYRGPMNAKGLGQLAYEKGIYVLTAAQSYQAAVEVKREGSGLMTFALMKEALEDRKAARVKSGQVLLTDWLAYPTLHVPRMQKDAMLEEQSKNNKSISFVDDSKLPPEERGLQRPRLFYRREAEVRPQVIAGVKLAP